jgi:outer membrane protein TolC
MFLAALPLNAQQPLALRDDAVLAAGMSTDVDVLSIRVHLAAVNEQRIRRSADLEVARAALNDAMGLALDTPHALTTALTPADLPELVLDCSPSSATTGAQALAPAAPSKPSTIAC